MDRTELQMLAQKERNRQQGYAYRVLCCGSTSCLAAGAETTQRTIVQTVVANQLNEAVEVVSTGCMGLCSQGPLIMVKKQGQQSVLYQQMQAEVVDKLVEQHLQQYTPLIERTLSLDLPFFAKQTKVVLENSGQINPERLEEYVAQDGYMALLQVLRDMAPEEVCAAITESGLQGRGGAGYSTGLKWDLVRKEAGQQKYVVANCDEGDPGAYMDRTLMESNPQLLLESMAIAGYAVGANQGYIFVRGGYPGASRRLERLERAIRSAEQHNLLGSRILESTFNFHIDLRVGPGAFVCGEETALMATIMGRRGQPVPRPPYPAQSGLWGCPTLLNNVETFGNVPAIITQGAEWYANIGTEKSKGTKVFALAGKLKHTGLIEVPMGTTLREIVYEIGGGINDGGHFKAVQTGGPSGGCIPAAYLNTPVDYEKFKALGSMIGSGGLIVLDDHTCMPDMAKFFMQFCMDESCGKCVPCRVGTVQLHRLLERMTNGSATTADMTILEELCEMVQETSLCGLGQSAPNPVLSTLRYFRDEYERHIRDRHCPAGVCQMTEVPVLELIEELPRRIQAQIALEDTI